MATQACNLSCEGCTNYSDLVHKGYVPWQEMKQDLTEWLDVIDIPDFGIIGGEPLLNPEILDWLDGIRTLMPNAQIRFTTNGMLLNKNMHLIDLMHNIGNVVFKITAHKVTEELNECITEIMRSFKWHHLREYGADRFVTTNNFKFYVKHPSVFYKTYKGTYSNMQPHNNDPEKAFDLCIQQKCPLLYKKNIYKCSTSGLLKETLIRTNNLKKEWKPFIPQGILPTSSIKDITTFIDNFGKANIICGQCPTNEDKESIIDHYSTVKIQKVKI